MSRIGRKPIQIPQGVDVTIGDALVQIKGPKGALSVALHPHVKALLSPDRILTVEVGNTEDINDRALWGLFRKLLANAVEGVQKPFEVKLEFIGVGYRVSVAGTKIQMEVGFSHPIEYQLPEGVSASVEKNTLTLTGIDKQAVGETAARIRRIRPPEPYKGKGIKYSDEVIRRKAGKAAKAGS
jgi:large subunit ribosomal protein L6